MSGDKKIPSYFFRGKAKMKFVSNGREVSNENSKHYEIDHFYDIEIKDIKETSHFVYKEISSYIRPKKKQMYALAQIGDRKYKIELTGLKIKKLPEPIHEQQIENQIVGELDWFEIIFSVPSKSQFSAEIETDNTKEENGIEYKEFILKTGESEWRVIKAPEGAETGRVQRKKNSFRKEHYRSDGETYWSSWKQEKDFSFPEQIQYGPTGLKKRMNNREFIQVYTTDGKFEYIPLHKKLRRSALASVTVVFIMSLFFYFLYYLSQNHDGFIIQWAIIPFCVYFFIIVPFSRKLMNTASYFSKIIFKISWFVIAILITSALIFSMSLGLNKMVGSFCENQDFKSDGKDHNGNKMITQNDSLYLEYSWYDSISPEPFHYNIKLNTSKDAICNCSSSGLRRKARFNLKDRYMILNNSANKYLSELKEEFLHLIREQNPNIEFDETLLVNAVISFIQSHENRGEEDDISNDLLSPGYVLFGIDDKNKISFKADCDDRTLTAYFLLHGELENIDVEIFNYNTDQNKHSMLGISGLKPFNSKFFLDAEGQRYFLWELTLPNSKLGQVSNKYRNESNWKKMTN